MKNLVYMFVESQIAKPDAIFQEKLGDKFVGLKIFYYLTPNKKHWFAFVSHNPYTKEIPNCSYGALGNWYSKKQYKNIAALVEYHKDDNIVKIS